MPSPRPAIVAVLVLRIAYGLGLIAAPGRLARRWLGPAADQPPTQVALRGLGAREVLLHAGALTAALRGDPVRPWLGASIAGDLTDLASTVGGRDGLPGGAATATAVVAGGSALISGLVAATAEA